MRGSDRVEGSVTNMGDSALIDRFLDMMAAEKGAAANTLLAYRSDLVQASVVLGGRLEHVDRNDLTKLRRSEEHTSELQSLMRISYAVFCLKEKSMTKLRSTNDATPIN